MKYAQHLLAAAVMLISVSACQTTGGPTGGGIGIGQAASADALKTAKVVLTGYVDVYQPAVLVYGRLPDCPGATICKDRAVLDKLKAADAAAMAAFQVAMDVIDGKVPDTGGDVLRAVQAVQQAEVQIATSGAMTVKP